MSDLIDRQAVIDTVHKIIYGFFSDEDGVMTDTEKTLLSVNKAICNELAKLPPAEPETHEKRTETHECDLISIQAVIRMFNTADRYVADSLRLCDTDKTFPQNEVFIVDDMYEGLEQLQSAEPEKRTITDCPMCPDCPDNCPLEVEHD